MTKDVKRDCLSQPGRFLAILTLIHSLHLSCSFSSGPGLIAYLQIHYVISEMNLSHTVHGVSKNAYNTPLSLDSDAFEEYLASSRQIKMRQMDLPQINFLIS